MNENKPLLQVEDLCVDFATRKGALRVLDHVGLHVNQGESLGIVGESGCGKSMTALAIMRLVPAPSGQITKGRIRLRGLNLLELSEKRMQNVRGNDISMIFQEPMTSLNPVFTIGMQIAESIERHQNASRAEALDKAAEILAAVQIPEAAQRLRQYPHELSGGMRQRVMIAMALSCQPSVLIADEPTTALDVTVQAQIFDLLLDIQNRMGTAIILITHDMGVIAETTDQVVVMYAGRKVEEGPVREIITSPRHPYTQGLLKCIPDLKADPVTEIPGIVPDLSLLDAGCSFRPRCPYSATRCREKKPPDFEVGENHRAACWLVEAV